MELWQAIVLGIVQGVTEFLPISSSGHLVLVRDLLDIELKHGLAFEALVHFGTASAVVLYFWRDLLSLSQTLFRKLGRLPVNEKDFTLLKALLVATIPAALLGFFLEPFIKEHFMTAVTIAVGLFAASSFFIYAEWKQFTSPRNLPLTPKRAFLVGLFQMIAFLPGLSRTGMTIAGGMLLGLSRYEAARFSFLLAIPITAGAGIKKSLDLIVTPGEVSWVVLMAGATTAFFLALIVIHFFLKFIRRYTLWPFIWYSISLAALIVYGELFAWS